MIANENDLGHPAIDCINFNDVIRISGEQLMDELSDSYGTCGLEGTIIVVNSNRIANRYNQGIRNRIFFRREEISPEYGDDSKRTIIHLLKMTEMARALLQMAI